MIVIAMILYLLKMVINLYFWIVIISALITWVNPDPYNRFVIALRKLTEPAFYMVRKHLPFTYTSGIDFSPVVILIGLKLAEFLVAYVEAYYLVPAPHLM